MADNETTDDIGYADAMSELEAILDAIRLRHQTSGLLTEPAGAVGIAAVLSTPNNFTNLRIATILCGNNLTPTQLSTWL